MMLCGSSMRLSIIFKLKPQWLGDFLAEGKKKGEFAFPGSAKDQAVLIMASLQGAIQMVCVTTPSCFDSTVKQIKHYVSP